MRCSRCPKECLYYERVLKKKCFRKLKNNVWENKVKWKLVEKANFYIRHKILEKYFNLWMTFLNESFLERFNLNTAQRFYEDKIKSKGIAAFRKNAERNERLLDICRGKLELNLKSRSWHKWKHYTLKRLKIGHIKLLANRIREERLLIRFLYLWTYRYRERYFEKEVADRAVRHYQAKLQATFFGKWKIYWRENILMKRLKDVSAAHFNEKLKRKVICSWKSHGCRQNALKFQITRFVEIYQNHLIKSYLTVWWFRQDDVRRKKDINNENLAVSFHSRKILEKSFRGLYKIAERERSKEEKVKEYFGRRERIYLSFYIDCWVKRWEEKLRWNDIDEKATSWREMYLIESFLTKLAEKHRGKLDEEERCLEAANYYGAVLLQKAFDRWKEVTTRKITKELLFENSMEFYRETLKRKFFTKWKEFMRMRLQKRFVISHRNYSLLCKSVNRWRDFVEEKKNLLVKVDSLKRIKNLNLLRLLFRTWREETRVATEKAKSALAHHKHVKLSKSFKLWRKTVQIKVAYRTQCAHNRNIISNILVRDYIFLWHSELLNKNQLKNEMDRGKRKREKRLKRLCLTNWLKFVDKMKTIRSCGECFPEVKSMILLEDYVSVMLEALRSGKVLKLKEKMAEQAQEKFVLRKHFRKWIHFILWKRETLLNNIYENKNCKNSRKRSDIGKPREKFSRRQPMIPDYLKTERGFNEIICEESRSSPKNGLTYRVLKPLNKRLPVIESEVFGSVEDFI